MLISLLLLTEYRSVEIPKLPLPPLLLSQPPLPLLSAVATLVAPLPLLKILLPLLLLLFLFLDVEVASLPLLKTLLLLCLEVAPLLKSSLLKEAALASFLEKEGFLNLIQDFFEEGRLGTVVLWWWYGDVVVLGWW